ncbi:matrixin family metalloprotease [Rhizobium sp. L1K21]|uniref:matrixin family metalloprotease n=1 Tax=Rhizobium sp. L1K21 TaxID=2954933 RepID=UPI0020923D20|nr:matrixin family metalloprotease [Rhizobium sp. L1K21]MCO6185361.1 matrixin family metalloprotease [Rhizobium sp. L1K21]
MRRRLARFFTFVFITTMVPVSAEAADYKLLLLEGRAVKWGEADYSRPAVVRYAFAKDHYADPGARNCASISGIEPLAERARVSTEVVEEEAAAAFAAWEAVANLRFIKSDDVEHADIVIGAQTKPRGFAYTNVRPVAPGLIGQSAAKRGERAFSIPDSQLQKPEGHVRAPVSPIAKALICFNPEKHWKVGLDGDLNVYDLRYTFMHEIGHAIGLDHVGQRGFLMNFRYTEDFTKPQPGDVAGAIVLYGPAVPADK